MLPPADAATHARMRDNHTIGDTCAADGSGPVLQPATASDPAVSPDNAAHTVLFPSGEGGFANTAHACTHAHYVHKMLGSVNSLYRRAEEFIWYRYQELVKRQLHRSAPRVVNATIAMNANKAALEDHESELLRQWRELKQAAPEYVPYCTTQESYTGTVGTKVVGSKAYWCVPRSTHDIPLRA